MGGGGCSGEVMSHRELDIGLGFGLVRVQIEVLSAWTDHRNHLWSRDVMGAHTRLVLLGGVRPERNYTYPVNGSEASYFYHV